MMHTPVTNTLLPISSDYRISVVTEGGVSKTLPAYSAHQHQPNSYRYHTELETFAQWHFSGRAQIRVYVLNPEIRLEEVAVRPRRAEIFPVVIPSERCVVFTIDTTHAFHRLLSVEIGGMLRPCFLFTDPPETQVPVPEAPGVVVVPENGNADTPPYNGQQLLNLLGNNGHTLYFPAGVYRLEYLSLQRDNLTLYFEEGAMLSLACQSELSTHNHATIRNGITITGENIRILGHGILDCKADTNQEDGPLTCRGNTLCLMDCHNVILDGLTFTHSLGFCLVALRCQEVQILHVKMAGCQDMTSNDGILIDGSQNALISGCFANNHDDSLEVKTHHYTNGPCEHVIFEDCLVWSRGGMPLAAAWETWWDIHDITWRRISVIHHENYGNGALCVYVGNRGLVSDLLFEDIDVEDTPFGGIAITVEEHPWSYWGTDFAIEAVGDAAKSTDPNMQWATIGNLHFKNITIRHSPGFNSRFYPRPRLPANGNGHGGCGYKLHIPMTAFSSGRCQVTSDHLQGKILFENVFIETYRDQESFPRFGSGADHDAGRPIPGHYLTDLTTDRWILWEGVNPLLWELIPGREPEDVYSPLPDLQEQEARIRFWEKHVQFLVSD